MAPPVAVAALSLSLLLLLLACSSHAARILVVFQMSARSHWRLGRAVAEGLHARGHHVTAVSPFPAEAARDNWTHVQIPNTMHLFGDSKGLFGLGKSNEFALFTFLSRFGMSSCEIFLQDEDVLRLFGSRQQFDVVVMELFFGECFLPLAHLSGAPIVGFSTIALAPWMGDLVGSPSPAAYVPDPFLPFSSRMTPLQRLRNAAFGAFCRLYRQLYYLPALDATIRRRLNASQLPPLSDMERSTALVLTNAHFSMFQPRPQAPGVVDVGGMHVAPAQQLPQDLQDLLDESKNGAILFSLGSNLQSSDMPEEKKTQFLEAFSKLPQTVIWKWEADTLQDKPKNLKISKWLPQSDILAHKNVKLFITHGGLLSLTEAVYHAVPVVAVPFFGDQEFNVVQAEQHGYALRLDFNNITAESLLWAIKEVLNNPRYQQRAAEVSRRFHDRPRSPMEELVFWTEYVVRHQGAPHLRSAAADLSWYQLLLLDVAAVALGAAVCALWLIMYAVRKAVHVLSAAGFSIRTPVPRLKELKKDE